MSLEEHRAHLESMPSPEGLERMTAALGRSGVPTNVQRLGGGVDAATSLFELDGERLVLKRFRPGQTGAGQEFANLQHAARSAVPTPAPVGLDVEGTWFGTEALVMSALSGRATPHPDDQDVWLQELAGGLAAVHDTPLDGFVAGPSTRVDRWQPFEHDSPARMAAMAMAVDELRGLVAGGPAVFTHDDYHPGNTLFSACYLTGVVDWRQATVEPREAAVAYCRSDLALHPGGDAPDRFLAAYEAISGVRLQHLGLWDVLQASRALGWGQGWGPAFTEIGVALTGDDIVQRAAEFIDRALSAAD